MHTYARFFTLLIASLLFAGCATASSSNDDLGDELGHAVVTPLNDLNLVRDKIPPILSAARKAPYALPEETDCDALAASIAELDAVLGADLDAPSGDSNVSLVERGAEELGDAAVDAVRSTAKDVIPFRSWVRKLTGAERHSRQVTAAIIAGTGRRAFLKGVAAGKGCAPLTEAVVEKAE
ncbi:MAG: hypothetical protein LBE50_06610 [Gallionellaceae bacterium]|jgi:hypothetical protein|nr:hypothetical protein [Gallionellaceae bacterium]